MHAVAFNMHLSTLVILVAATQVIDALREVNHIRRKDYTVAVAVNSIKQASTLPFFLTCLHNLDYAKDRMELTFYIDNPADESELIIDTWIKGHKKEYGNVYVVHNKSSSSPPTPLVNETTEWTKDRLEHIISLREKAIDFARGRWADFLFMLDADVFLTDTQTLKKMVRKKLPIVAPMLNSDGLYSNFWASMSATYYYEKSEHYEEIRDRSVVGCFPVPMVHSAVLINLRSTRSGALTYDPAKLKDYTGPTDDIIAFAISASKNKIPMTVCNDRLYGFLPVPVDMNYSGMKTNESEQLLNVKMEALSQGVVFPIDPILSKFVKWPKKDRLGLEQVFVINLERREKRRRLMEDGLKHIGVEATLVKAFDGHKLNMEDLNKIPVTLMPNYEDPYHKRPMKAGEVGCFISHYVVWREIAKKSINTALVLEDDVRFTPFFRRKFQELMADLENQDWEFVYIGRKVLMDSEEEYVATHLTRPLYSYWTLGYLISRKGATKLLNAEPLSKMLPVDEFLPIMFDQHPNETWKQWFRNRNLKAFSAAPLLVYPTHYTGQEGYVSDTEDSNVLPVTDRVPATQSAQSDSDAYVEDEPVSPL